ncbi:hypothetical protein BDL97_11G089900 [Sphagnum fallax]|nr:hypothetical protein BDL97_11G089900 [Sphagnum fallax]
MILHLLQLGSHQCWLEYLWVPIINMHNGQICINRFWIWPSPIFGTIGFQCTQAHKGCKLSFYEKV